MRLAAKVIATLGILVLLILTILIALLHTRHAAPVLSQLVASLSPYTLSSEQVDYDIRRPWHLTLQAPTLSLDDNKLLHSDNIELWLSPATTLHNAFRRLNNPKLPFHWAFDSLLIDGINTDTQYETNLAALSQLPAMSSQRLALKNFSYHNNNLRLEHAQIEVDHWHSPALVAHTQSKAEHNLASWGHFSGNFRLAAPSAQWQQYPITQLLLDGEKESGEKEKSRWTLYGYSFNWQGANIGGQAELTTSDSTHQLHLHQLSINQLRFNSAQRSQELVSQWQTLLPANTTLSIGRLDINNGHIELADLAFNQLNLSLLNWDSQHNVWQQSHSQLSLSADSILWRDSLWQQPLLDLSFTPKQIELVGLSSELWQGYVRAKGTLTPDTLALGQLTLNNLKVFLPANWRQQAQTWLQPLKQISVEKLDIGYVQLTAAEAAFPFHISGWHLDGQDLTLKQADQWGLWHGKLTTNAGFASFNTVELIEPFVRMTSKQGHWQLNQLTLPFSHGLVEGQADIDLASAAKPWQLALSVDSAPADILAKWLTLPLPLSGSIDSQISASGLAANPLSLAYSLSGQLEAQFRDLNLNLSGRQLAQQLSQWPTSHKLETDPVTMQTVTHANQVEEKQPTKLATSLSPLTITSERGHITLSPLQLENEEFKATLKGSWDLAAPKQQRLQLEILQPCRWIRVWQSTPNEMDDHQQTTSSSPCEGNNI
ncbi:hypothetical protein A3K86_00800 [Photobacterium jeanii]|uniref:AsmA domain-containing protein n=1 Tax=Photobacterium jeanii TaxID=858640 RepID=A0A178KQI2_9GAMM|nr:AsmA family protein [Photobacterium jeanii]OAN19205.1 hypothetical protein A3K86_00800 [Photobacterium jeanii]PST87213.1 AsmA family protein [Photobacterium jeanii]